jgi:exodeoxyribonuclease V beta subunit
MNGAPATLATSGRWLVEASAGTGKTHRIEGLVLGLVADGTPLERLLIVTFTRAAAAELRRRVRRRLVRAADAVLVASRGGDAEEVDDDVLAALVDGAGADRLAELEGRLRRALERIDDAVIDTIHGFCRRMLTQAALEVDLDPTAEPVEDIGPLVREVVTDLLVAELRHASPQMHALIVGRHRLDQDEVLAIARRLESEPSITIVPEPPGGRRPDGAGPIVPLLEPRLAAVVEELRRDWRVGGAALWEELVAAHKAKRTERSLYIPSKAGRDREVVDAWASGAAPVDATVLRALRPFARSRIERRGADGLTVASPIPDLVDRLDGLATEFLVDLAHRLRHELTARKRRRRALSYTDLLVALETALRDPVGGDAVRGAVRARFDAALIDEFQDTDPVQWAIFARLFPVDDDARRAGRLDLVGDPKQAIYAFRGADVATYLVARGTVPVERRTGLDVNWRSDEGLVDGLNALLDRPERFGAEGPFGDADVAYEPVRAARAGQGPGLVGAEDPSAPVVIEFVRRDADDGEGPRKPGKPLSVGWAARHLPRLVADRIVRLLESGTEVDDPERGRRRVHAGDVAVLVRTHRQGEAMRSALARADVPSVARSQDRVLAAREAADLERVLVAFLRPGSERRLRAALATPLVGASACELADLDEDARLVWEERLAAWAERWRRDGIAAAVEECARGTGMPARLVATRRGERALTNVRHLVELLAAVERRERLGPEALVAWLARERIGGSGSEEQELRLESDAEAVRVVTVHSAKGLEYPVVHCPFLWSARRTERGERALRLHDPELGGLVLDLELSEDEVDHARRLLVLARDREREDLRLTYVALTRARHRVVLATGAFNRAGSSPLQHLLFGRPPHAPDALHAPDDARSDEDLLAELAPLAGPSVAVIEIDDVRDLPRRLGPVAGAERADRLEVRDLARPIDRSWRRASFTSLVHGELRDGAPASEGIDHDELVATDVDGLVATDVDGLGAAVGTDGGPVAAGAPAPAVAADGGSVPLDWFPAGATAGDLLHRLLERLDPTLVADAAARIDELRVLVAELVADGADRRIAAALGDDGGLLRLADGLGRVMTTPLGPPLADATLAGIARRDRLHELRFDLPIAPGPRGETSAPTLTTLADVIDAHAADGAPVLGVLADRLRRRPVRPLRGLLTGSIDLVARVDGRYAVLDHKSNRLPSRSREPSTVAHYARLELDRAIAERDYAFQGLLYVLALHRHLRLRLAGYDYDAHVAGAAFLFLRGMVGADAPRGADGAPSGVWWFRPSRVLIEALDAAIAGDRTEEGA